MTKRYFDFFVALTGLLLLSPMLIFIFLLIRVIDGAPVIFRQKRVGVNGRLFTLYKFRTMFNNEEKDVKLSIKGDTRITKLGNFLRKYKLDEFPQLFNVLIGDMSFVGYRPEIPFYVEKYTEPQKRILSYKPGIVDPATFLFRNEAEILSKDNTEEDYINRILPLKIDLSLKYAKEATFLSDLKCIIKTICTIFKDKNC